MNDIAQKKRRGIALPVVLVVVSLLALAGYTFSELMLAEYHALDKLDAAYRTGDRALIRNKIRAWQRISQRRRHLG